ncbi:MAG: hypothetical protein OJI67_24405 [Prosthecobacter sp.]|nr:hypothetical protein [Prosthecobacter sp.]
MSPDPVSPFSWRLPAVVIQGIARRLCRMGLDAGKSAHAPLGALDLERKHQGVRLSWARTVVIAVMDTFFGVCIQPDE